MKFFIAFTFIFLLKFISISQDFTYEFHWGSDTLSNNSHKILVCKEFEIEFNRTYLIIDLKIENHDVKLKNVKLQELTSDEIVFVKSSNLIIDSVNFFSSFFVQDQNDNHLFLKNSSIIFDNNKYYKVISITYSFSEKSFSNSRKRINHPIASVLSDAKSNWFKFPVNESGFYKITYKQLSDLGLNPKNNGFSAFHIYGNSTGRLPELNSDFRDLDLVQNNIYYKGNEDGVFDENDAIIFYSPGPNLIKYNTKDSLFYRDLNYYSDYTYYFLRFSNNVNNKLVTEIDNGLKSSNLHSFENDIYAIHEIEDTSLVFGGKRWYGELFDYTTRRDFIFDGFTKTLNNLVITVSGATDARIYESKINVYLDNVLFGSFVLESVSSEYLRVEKKLSISSHKGFKTLTIELVKNSSDTKFFLDKIEINARNSVQENYYNQQFTNKRMIGKGYFKYYVNAILDQYKVVDVTNPTAISFLKTFSDENGYYFIDSMQSLKTYALLGDNIKSISSKFTVVDHQNLHSLDLVDMLIVTPKIFYNQAIELKTIHEEEGLRVEVVTDEQVYNEFSSGSVDPTAIKHFAKCVYDKQKNNAKDRLKYLLLFGDGTFDYKNRIKGNNNFIPTYQFDDSEDFLSAMVSDDYFGMMDDNESIKGTDLLDIAVGRMIVSTEDQANQMINKIKQYKSISLNQNDWISKVVMITDDEEGGYFVNNDGESQSDYLKINHPEINIVKLYSDAFQQVTTAGGERYPSLNVAIDNQIFNGALVVSYIGHGGPAGAAEERILTLEQIANYKNSKLPLFVSSTCEFTKYDDPTRISAGEVMYLNPSGGAIALMTTTRPVYFGVNTISGNAFFKNVFLYDSITKQPLTFGEILRRTKNQSGTSSNRRSFTLIGDPALKINFPNYGIIIDSVNNIDLKNLKDTLNALSHVQVTGHIVDQNKNNIDLDGNTVLTFYDKSTINKTLGQNIDSPIIDFESQNSLLFKGAASVKKGKFKVGFIIPKDIDLNVGKGKISVVSYTNSFSGIGYSDSILIGGIKDDIIYDTIGPIISMSLDSTKNVQNGIVSENQNLYVTLQDESGINIASSGIGHQISLVLDNEVSNMIDLNSYYTADKDSYKKGKIIYPLPALGEGNHVLKLKAWDAYNNSSEKELSFSIVKSSDNKILRVLNYPNPFSTSTKFFIEHNLINNLISVKLEIFTISGKLVKHNYFENIAFRSSFSDFYQWDGKDDFGDKIGKGVYLYKITIVDSEGKTDSKVEKLVIF